MAPFGTHCLCSVITCSTSCHGQLSTSINSSPHHLRAAREPTPRTGHCLSHLPLPLPLRFISSPALNTGWSFTKPTARASSHSHPQAHTQCFCHNPPLGGNRWVKGCEHFKSSTTQPKKAFQEPHVRWHPCPQSVGCLVPIPFQPQHQLQVGEGRGAI